MLVCMRMHGSTSDVLICSQVCVYVSGWEHVHVPAYEHICAQVCMCAIVHTKVSACLLICGPLCSPLLAKANEGAQHMSKERAETCVSHVSCCFYCVNTKSVALAVKRYPA